MNTPTASTITRVEELKYRPWEDELPQRGGIEVADIDWFAPIQAKVYRYPENYVTEWHTISKKLTLIILKGEVLFEMQNESMQIAGPGTFHTCGEIAWRTTILQKTYFLVINEGDAEMKFTT